MLWKIWPMSVKQWKPVQTYRARVCLHPLNLSNVCDFSWSRIREFTRFKKGKKNSSYSRRQRNELKSVMHIQCRFSQKTNCFLTSSSPSLLKLSSEMSKHKERGKRHKVWFTLTSDYPADPGLRPLLHVQIKVSLFQEHPPVFILTNAHPAPRSQ